LFLIYLMNTTFNPKIEAPLDKDFKPAVLANRQFSDCVSRMGNPVEIQIALEQADGSTSVFKTFVAPPGTIVADANFHYIERIVKFLLWSRGGYRIYISGSEDIAKRLSEYYRNTPTGRFDSNLIGEKVYDHPIEVIYVQPNEIPAPKMKSTPLGRHWDGCRVGFDLGASDRKTAAVIDGEVIFTNETPWNPSVQSDPQYHFDGIMDSIRQAAAHLPRVDAIGGSSAGIYVNNQVKVASLFRSVPPDLFQKRVKNLFFEIKQAWNNVPFEVANDGEVTALAGSMALNDNAVLGIAMGSSQAAGYVTPEGNITCWLNELAFAPVDYNPNAPVDEWSGDKGCGVQYFSQQAVGRLAKKAGIQLEPDMPLPEILKYVQQLVQKGDPRAIEIFQTIGVYFGYAIAHYADFYEFKHVLVLGRVTSGPAGEIIVQNANNVLKIEFPNLAEKVKLHLPGEKEKRHGQAVAAASLPVIPK
jgi:predicted NBD/HSP70 family sugar kinase